MAYYQSTAKKTGVAFGMMQSAAGAVISNEKWKILFLCQVQVPGTAVVGSYVVEKFVVKIRAQLYLCIGFGGIR